MIILSTGSVAKIPASFQSILSEVQLAIETAFAHQLHSIYVFGSVASGNARLQSSDLDIFIEDKPRRKQQITSERLYALY